MSRQTRTRTGSKQASGMECVLPAVPSPSTLALLAGFFLFSQVALQAHLATAPHAYPGITTGKRTSQDSGRSSNDHRVHDHRGEHHHHHHREDAQEVAQKDPQDHREPGRGDRDHEPHSVLEHSPAALRCSPGLIVLHREVEVADSKVLPAPEQSRWRVPDLLDVRAFRPGEKHLPSRPRAPPAE